VLFRQEFWQGLANGSITVAFRRWKRPSVRAGGSLRSPGGFLAIDEVTPIMPDQVTDADARAAGYRDAEHALAELRPESDLYRIRFHRAGDDPRVLLREDTAFGPHEAAKLLARLEQLEWALPTLQLIAERPGIVSTELAAEMSMERPEFKQRVRRLKALGLTESLKVGYKLSPRGRSFLEFVRIESRER
jgi:hypothetical protein